MILKFNSSKELSSHNIKKNIDTITDNILVSFKVHLNKNYVFNSLF